MKKLNLDDLSVKSFVTEMDYKTSETAKGGSFGPLCQTDANGVGCTGYTYPCTDYGCEPAPEKTDCFYCCQ